MKQENEFWDFPQVTASEAITLYLTVGTLATVALAIQNYVNGA